ncbi:MAG: DUF4079 domain-containing protein [Moorea sp. SIO2I5]|nr:DUF4079 domain-containing protein [Moorena sp. SIO2I5]
MNLPESVKFWSQFFHPVLMLVLLGATFYALDSGLKIQKTRTAKGDEKRALVKGKYYFKHYLVGSALLALMVLGNIVGMAVTYINNSKLFVDTHLLAGLAMTGIIATSAALTPLMQKGQTWARYSHIVLNVTLLGLFIWEAITGMEIMQRILSNP